MWDKRKLSEIRGWLLWLGGSTGPPSGPCLPVAVPPGRASHATWGLVCVATGDRRPALGLWNHSFRGRGRHAAPGWVLVAHGPGRSMYADVIGHRTEDNVTDFGARC